MAGAGCIRAERKQLSMGTTTEPQRAARIRSVMPPSAPRTVDGLSALSAHCGLSHAYVRPGRSAASRPGPRSTPPGQGGTPEDVDGQHIKLQAPISIQSSMVKHGEGKTITHGVRAATACVRQHGAKNFRGTVPNKNTGVATPDSARSRPPFPTRLAFSAAAHWP